MRKQGFLDFSAYGISPTANEIRNFFTSSPFLKAEGLADEVAKLGFAEGRMDFGRVKVNSYFASVAVDWMRQKLLEQKTSFTFETVMSHPGKVDLLAQAQAASYRTYLYFVATDDPAINISRVQNRVRLHGHDVPADKITPRYYRSLDLLMEAIQHTNRAYVFDNSGDNADGRQTWLAEITEGKKLELKTDQMPSWFIRAVLDKIK
jgi:predicted ABC-type ATPase